LEQQATVRDRVAHAKVDRDFARAGRRHERGIGDVKVRVGDTYSASRGTVRYGALLDALRAARRVVRRRLFGDRGVEQAAGIRLTQEPRGGGPRHAKSPQSVEQSRRRAFLDE